MHLRRDLPAAVALLVAACAAKPPLDASSAKATRYAVATENAAATHAAAHVLEAGGNAFDAAIAGALALDVVQSASTGIGGGGFALVWDAKKKEATAIDFRETAPAHFDPATFDLPGAPEGVKIGVPGGIDGFATIHRMGAVKSWAEDVKPAIDLAERGYPISPHMARALKMFGHRIGGVGALGAMLVPAGKPANAGDVVTWPALAATLRTIATKGPRAFYEGEIARSIVDTAKKAGSAMTTQDLAEYRAEVRVPLEVHWEGLDVLTMPPPSAGGMLLVETLEMFSKADVTSSPARSADAIHALAEAFRGAFADRVRYVGDPAKVAVDLAPVLAKARMDARRASIDPKKTRTPAMFVKEDHGTTHITVADAEGNVVSLTTTLNNPWGSNVYDETTGILLNDELDDFATAKLAATVGVADLPGGPKPGARPPSSMTPAIVLENGSMLLALGGAGGIRIATNVTQVLLQFLARGATLEEAERAPRIGVNPDGALVLEPGAVDDAVKEDLVLRGETVKEEPAIASVDAVARRGGAFSAVGEPRRWGLGVVR